MMFGRPIETCADCFDGRCTMNCSRPIRPEEPPPPSLLIDILDHSGNIRPMADLERQIIVAVLAHHGGHMAKTARALKIGRSSLYRKVEKYDG